MGRGQPGVPNVGRPRKLPVSNGKSQLWKNLRLVILERDNYTCQHCGITVQLGNGSAHVDHIIPRVEGGTTTPDNLETLCRTCNTTKGALEGAKAALAKRAKGYEPLKESETSEAPELLDSDGEKFVPTEFHPAPGIWEF